MQSMYVSVLFDVSNEFAHGDPRCREQAVITEQTAILCLSALPPGLLTFGHFGNLTCRKTLSLHRVLNEYNEQ